MLKKLLEFAGFPGLIRQAQDVVQTVEKQGATQAAASLLKWLPGAMERCHSPAQQLELLNTISPAVMQILGNAQRELMEGADNEVRGQLLLRHAAPLAAWMRDQYRSQLHQALPGLQKSGPLALWAQAVTYLIDWTSQAYMLSFLTPPVHPGLEWHTIHPLYEPTKQMLDRGGSSWLLGRSEIHRQQLQKSLARLLLLVRSLSTELKGRQVLIAARFVEILHPFLHLGDRHGQQTPYGTDIGKNNPPTLIGGTKPLQEGHRFFFGMEQALVELVGLENLVLSQPALPEAIVVASGQSTPETLAVIKHLRSRWSGRPVVRKAGRMLAHCSVELIAGQGEIQRLLFGEASLALGQKGGTRVKAAMEDRSATGYGLMIEGPAPWAVVGTLIAVLPGDLPRWVLATVRRVAPYPRNRLMLGVQLLSMEPQALRLHLPGKATEWQLVDGAESLDAESCIYLPASPLNSGKASVLTADRTLNSGQLYHARRGNRELSLRVQAVQELGNDYVLYACEVEELAAS